MTVKKNRNWFRPVNHSHNKSKKATTSGSSSNHKKGTTAATTGATEADSKSQLDQGGETSSQLPLLQQQQQQPSNPLTREGSTSTSSFFQRLEQDADQKRNVFRQSLSVVAQKLIETDDDHQQENNHRSIPILQSILPSRHAMKKAPTRRPLLELSSTWTPLPLEGQADDDQKALFYQATSSSHDEDTFGTLTTTSETVDSNLGVDDLTDTLASTTWLTRDDGDDGQFFVPQDLHPLPSWAKALVLGCTAGAALGNAAAKTGIACGPPIVASQPPQMPHRHHHHRGGAGATMYPHRPLMDDDDSDEETDEEEHLVARTTNKNNKYRGGGAGGVPTNDTQQNSGMTKPSHLTRAVAGSEPPKQSSSNNNNNKQNQLVLPSPKFKQLPRQQRQRPQTQPLQPTTTKNNHNHKTTPLQSFWPTLQAATPTRPPPSVPKRLPQQPPTTPVEVVGPAGPLIPQEVFSNISSFPNKAQAGDFRVRSHDESTISTRLSDYMLGSF